MGKRVSIKDIARAAAMSHSTVSRALRGSALVSDETRGRIERLARQMGYSPDAVAQSLQTRRTNSIGLVVTSIADPFFADVVKGVEEVARPAGLSVFLNSSHNDPDQEIHVIETFHRRRVDGIIVASSRIGSNHADRLAKIHAPVVLVNAEAEGHYERFCSVAVDDQEGARMAVEHLIQLGHERIAYLGVSNRPRSNRRRFEGYREALLAAGIRPHDELVCIAHPIDEEREGDVDLARIEAKRLLDAGATAIFCFNDMIAIGVRLACSDRGASVPGDVSIVGFDDIDPARYVTPSLTTIRQPKRELGSLALSMLIDLMNGAGVDHRVLTPELVCRESAAPPRMMRSPSARGEQPIATSTP